MLRIVLWALAAIVVVDILIAVVIAAYAAVDRHRHGRQLRRLEELWRLDLPGASSTRHRAARRRRVLVPALMGAVLIAGTAVASPGALDAVGSVFSSFVDRLGISRGPRVVEAFAEPIDETPTPRSDVPRSDQRASEPRRGEGRSPADDPAPGSGGHATATAPGSPGGPAAPAKLTAVAGSPSSIVLAWTDTSRELGFRVERSSDGVGDWTSIAVSGQDVTTYSDQGLTSSTTYYYRVVAFNAEAEAAPSDIASATTIVDVPSATTLMATPSSSSEILLSWTDVGSETGYRVERSTDGETGWITIATAGQDVTTYLDAGLDAGTTYWYRVVATNPGGDALPSAVATATTSTIVGTPVEPAPIDPDAAEPA